MANVKIDQMVEDTTPLDTDEYETQKTGGGLSRKQTRQTILRGVYGLISVQANSTAETTVDSTPRITTAWNTNGLSRNTSVDHTDDSIKVLSGSTGTFEVDVSLSFSGTGTSTYQLEIYVYDDSATSWGASGFASDRLLGTGGDVGSITISGIVALDTNDKVAVYQSTTDGSAMTVTEAQIKIKRVE